MSDAVNKLILFATPSFLYLNKFKIICINESLSLKIKNVHSKTKSNYKI